jgi:hypothetical protein
MKAGTVSLVIALLLALAVLGGGWKWTHGPGSRGAPTAAQAPDGWTWDM